MPPTCSIVKENDDNLNSERKYSVSVRSLSLRKILGDFSRRDGPSLCRASDLHLKKTLASQEICGEHKSIAFGLAEMWIELTPDEANELLSSTGNETIRQKLTEAPHPHTGIFADAASRSSDCVHIPIDTVIDRTRNGAYVLTWTWVYNEQAGFKEPSNFNEFDISADLHDRLNRLHNFTVEHYDGDSFNNLCAGQVDGYPWSMVAKFGEIRFTAFGSLGHWAWVDNAPLPDNLEDQKSIPAEIAFTILTDVVEKYRSLMRDTV